MNTLFEAYVAQQLTRAAPALGCQVRPHDNRAFWQDVQLWPDIVVTLPGARAIVLDTKWKLPATHRPAAADLQQLFAYCHLWHARHGLLLYPNPAAGARTSMQQSYAPGHLGVAVHGHVVFANILLADGRLNHDFGRELLAQLRSYLLCPPPKNFRPATFRYPKSNYTVNCVRRLGSLESCFHK